MQTAVLTIEDGLQGVPRLKLSFSLVFETFGPKESDTINQQITCTQDTYMDEKEWIDGLSTSKIWYSAQVKTDEH